MSLFVKTNLLGHYLIYGLTQKINYSIFEKFQKNVPSEISPHLRMSTLDLIYKTEYIFVSREFNEQLLEDAFQAIDKVTF